jgi:hypothetical protein
MVVRANSQKLFLAGLDSIEAEFYLESAKHPFLEKLQSKIITGNSQDSIAASKDARLSKKVCRHILAFETER